MKKAWAIVAGLLLCVPLLLFLVALWLQSWGEEVYRRLRPAEEGS